MQVTVEEVSPLTRKLKIVLPSEQVSPKIEDAYRNLSSEISIKGFRKGKVPRKILEKNYGPRVEHEVGEKLVQETYFDALEETKLEAVVHPEIQTAEFGEDGTFSYEAQIDIKPQFELGQYKGLQVEMPEITVSEEEVNAELETLRRQMAPLRSVEDRAVQDGDLVVIDFQGYHQGEEMKQVAGENYSVEVGSGRNGKEFEENLVGLQKEEKTTREIEFPAGFPNPVLADKKIEFRITVKDIKERVLAEVDDEFAKDVSEELKTLEDLRKKIRERLQQEKETAQKGFLSDKIMMKLLEAHAFELPQRLVTYEINEIIKETEANLQRQGLTLEAAGMNRDKMKEQYRELAQKRVRGDFILKKIAEVEDIKVAEEDISKGFERIAAQYAMPVDEVKRYFKNRDDLLPFMNELLNEKILDFLRRETKVTPLAAGETKDSGEKPAAAGEETAAGEDA